jgi:hypothetical protein
MNLKLNFGARASDVGLNHDDYMPKYVHISEARVHDRKGAIFSQHQKAPSLKPECFG